MPLINRCGGGGGTPQLCGQVENFKVLPGTVALTAALSWTAPSPDEDNSFVGARIVRKTGSAPTGINDGTVVYEGTALTYTDTGLTAGTTYYYRAFAYNARTKYQTELRVVSVVATSVTVKPVLNDNTWAEIKAASDAGIAASVWSVGDTKSITVSSLQTYMGSTTAYKDIVVDAFILGFDHNSNLEGDKRIHFHIGKQEGKQVGLSEYYQSSVLTTSQILTKLSSDLQAVLKTTTKYRSMCDYSSGGQGYVQSLVSETGKLFLLGCVECFGSGSVLASYIGNKQQVYDYYKAGNSLVHYASDNQPTANSNFSGGDGQRETYLRDAHRYSNREEYCYEIDFSGYEKKGYPSNDRILCAPIFFV